jgi:uncharacterized membrane protein
MPLAILTTRRPACESSRVRNRRRSGPVATESTVLDAIRARGTRNFTGAEIAREAGLCRQTVYKVIARLNGQGHRIEGAPRLGFMARLGRAK